MAELAHQEDDTLQFRDPLVPDFHVVYWTRSGPFEKDQANILFWCHGIGEHVGRHHQLASRLLAQTPLLDAVISFDHRGHGKSTGARGCAASFEQLADDAFKLVIPHVALRYGVDPRIVLGGHSMGGAVVATIATRPDTLKADAFGSVVGVFLSSPGLKGIVPEGLNRALAPLVSVANAIPGIKSFVKSSGINPEYLCHDPSVIKAYQEDPLV